MAAKFYFLPLTNDSCPLERYNSLQERIDAIASHEPDKYQNMWIKKSKDGYENIDLSTADQCLTQFIVKRMNDQKVTIKSDIRKKWEKQLLKRDQEMLKGKVFSGSFLYEDVIHQVSVGVLDIEYADFFLLMPAHTYGINQIDYKGGEVKTTTLDNKGLVCAQRERLCVKRFFAKYPIPFIYGKRDDVIKIETIKTSSNKTILHWEMVRCDSNSVIKDSGELCFVARKDGRMQIEFMSEYRLDMWPHGVLCLKNIEKCRIIKVLYEILIAKGLRNHFTKTIRHWQKIALGNIDPVEIEDISIAPLVWKNWSGNIRNTQNLCMKPQSNLELEQLVNEAVKKGHKIRVVGGGHSWSPITKLDDENGLLLSLAHMNKILKIDKESMRVKMEAGILLCDLNEKLAISGLALPNLGAINKQSIAGAISTSTHGSGINFQTISNLVTELEIIDGKGQTHICSEKSDPDLFAAARCALGTLGIIKSVTLQCVCAFNLKQEIRFGTVNEVIKNLNQFIGKNEYFKFWWIPHTNLVALICWNRTSLPVNRGRFNAWFYNLFLQNFIPQIAVWITAIFPDATRCISKIIGFFAPKYTCCIDRSDKILNIPALVKHVECEYAIPLKFGMEAFEKVINIIEAEKFNIGFPVIDLRFVKGDNILLSPAYGRDTCYIGLLQSPYLPNKKLFLAIEKIMHSYNGRPHWGKLHSKHAHDLQNLYPEINRFLIVRERMDPNNLFMSAYLNRLLRI